MDLNQELIPVCLLEVSNKQQMIKMGTVVVKCELVELANTGIEENSKGEGGEGELTAFLLDLFQRSPVHVNGEQQKILRHLLVRNQESFS